MSHPKTRFIAFTGSRDVGLHINELAAKTQPGQIWIKRVVAEMGGKDAIIVDADCDLDAAVEGVAVSAFGYQGQKCSACSRAIVDAKVYDRFPREADRPREEDFRGTDGRSRELHGSRDQRRRPRRSILEYIDTGKREGRLLTGGKPPAGDGYFVAADDRSPMSIRKARIFQEEIFGPVLAVTKARISMKRSRWRTTRDTA